MDKNYYKILNIPNNASENEIKSSFRKLAKLHHPDKNQCGSDDLFKQINDAYKTLMDFKLRSDYDSDSDFQEDSSWEELLKLSGKDLYQIITSLNLNHMLMNLRLKSTRDSRLILQKRLHKKLNNLKIPLNKKKIT